ncbi:MAG: hypothetical protein ACXAB2_11680 [Candidatus Hodarchaeales archaeon]|jgi:hypothetical protein
MSEDMIQKITEEVLKKLDQTTPAPQRPTEFQPRVLEINDDHSTQGTTAIILLCGGDRELPEVMKQIELITKSYTKTYIAMTHAAMKIIGVPDIRKVSEGATIITEYSSDYFDNVLRQCDRIYVPILSLNTAAKVVALNADSLGTITIVFGLMYGILLSN